MKFSEISYQNFMKLYELCLSKKLAEILWKKQKHLSDSNRPNDTSQMPLLY